MDDDAVTQRVQPEPSVDVWPVTAGPRADDDAVPQPVMSQPEHSGGAWPIAADRPADGDGRPPRPIVIQPKVYAGSWLIIAGPRAAPRLRLFCFPFAGGGSAVYRTWAQFIDPTIEVSQSSHPAASAALPKHRLPT